MTRQLMVALVLNMLCTYAFAGERIETYNPYRSEAVISSETSPLELLDFRIVLVPTKVKITESENCEDNALRCSRNEVLEKAEVLRLSYAYTDTRWTSDDAPYDYLDFYFPVSILSANELADLRRLSRGVFDLLGRKVRSRLIIANRLFEQVTTSRKMVTHVIDYQSSTFCETDDRWCTEDIRYVKKTITVKDVKVKLK